MSNHKGKIIVTGGTGFIGSHTAVVLRESGFMPVLVDDLSNSSRDVLQGIRKITGSEPEFHQVDLTNGKAIKSLFESMEKVLAVVHFAAFKAVGESVQKPLEYYRNNLGGLVNLLSCMAESQVPHLIFSSSCTVYGDPDSLPLKEDSPVKPAASPYGNTKQVGEEIIRDAINAGHIRNAVSLRYFNPVGAHSTGLIGELPIGVPNNLMPYITQTAAGMRKELKVFGNDYNTPDGTAVRDYIHVEDLAAAHVKSIEYLLEGRNENPYEIFNLGTGKGHSVLEVIRSFEKTSGTVLNYSFAPRRAGDVQSTYADPSRAEKLLNWRAGKSLDEMTSSAWKWEKKLRGLS